MANRTNHQNLEVIQASAWQDGFSTLHQQQAMEALECGKVLYLPALNFFLSEDERPFLSADILTPKAKNISFNANSGELKGSMHRGHLAEKLKAMMQRYAENSTELLKNLLPFYTPHLLMGKTSFRPVEVAGRKTSYRKDDTRLHLDSFPSNPTQGLRILRVFTNVNPAGKPRIWRVGEPMEAVMQRFLPSIRRPILGSSTLLKALGITKDYRTAYDHYMLKIHDRMKEDTHYQQTASCEEVHFPSFTTWIVFTDQVSHAAMSGQHLFEQTFYLPVHGLKRPSSSPLKVLEKMLKKRLV